VEDSTGGGAAGRRGFKIKVIRKIAKPCGIAGGIWGLLAPTVVLLPITERGATPPVTVVPGYEVAGIRRLVLGLGKEMVSMVEAGVAGDILPILSFIALMGLLGLLAIVLHKRKSRLGKLFLWISALAILAVSLFGFSSLGMIFLPAGILLMLAAMGVREGEGVLVQEEAKR